MQNAYIVGAVRTPVGRRGGGLSNMHPADLGAFALSQLMARVNVDPGLVDDVIFGCVSQGGAQASNIARVAWLSAGLPSTVPGVVIDRRCGSGQQAIEFAANAVRSGEQDLVVAGGVESMSVVPMGSPALLGTEAGHGTPYGGEGWRSNIGGDEPSQFVSADRIAVEWGLSRAEMEEYALESHRRAVEATRAGYFEREVAPLNEIRQDEGPRPDTSLEKMASLKPLLPDGRITAALSSQVSDAAAAVLIASKAAVERLGLTPRARIAASAVVGADPVLMLTGPIPATAKILSRTGMAIDNIDLFEVNEAFASIVMAWAADTKAPLERTNVNGGAISLGHPLGATGARLMTTLLHELERRDGQYGLQVMCEGGGTANATLIERL